MVHIYIHLQHNSEAPHITNTTPNPACLNCVAVVHIYIHVQHPPEAAQQRQDGQHLRTRERD